MSIIDLINFTRLMRQVNLRTLEIPILQIALIRIKPITMHIRSDTNLHAAGSTIECYRFAQDC